MPFTISKAMPENVRSLKRISENGSTLKYGSISAIPIAFPLGSASMPMLPANAPIPINKVQNIKSRRAVRYLDFFITLTSVVI